MRSSVFGAAAPSVIFRPANPSSAPNLRQPGGGDEETACSAPPLWSYHPDARNAASGRLAPSLRNVHSIFRGRQLVCFGPIELISSTSCRFWVPCVTRRLMACQTQSKFFLKAQRRFHVSENANCVHDVGQLAWVVTSSTASPVGGAAGLGRKTGCDTNRNCAHFRSVDLLFDANVCMRRRRK